jgi:5'-nucleotidase
MHVLLTNDDGIEETGLRALHGALTSVPDVTVTVVAPADDQSAVGRSLSARVAVDRHDLGYAVHGTPADCVVAGVQSLVPDVDLVVSGCNRGANLGQYTLGRSGTVSAAVEAAFFDRPAIAVSMYIPTGDEEYWSYAPDVEDYAEAARATGFLVGNAFEAGVFEEADYLNVNAPLAREERSMEITEPSTVYQMDAEYDDGDGEVTLHDRIWERMAEGDIPDPQGTDRRAVLEGRVSVSPLAAPHTIHHHDALDELATAF